jgi:hypothetical protein
LVERYDLKVDRQSIHLSPDFRVLALRSGE